MKNKHVIIWAFILSSAVTLFGCKNANENNVKPESAQNAEVPVAANLASYPLKTQFACLPKEAAFVAAHRGVSKGKGFAENSAGSLKALIGKGVMFAEVDVAGLKDGTLILFHDGVWEEKTTGRGAVAAGNWGQAQKILLKDTDGKVTAERPVKFSDALSLASGQIYLEVDFKSSAKYESVITEIRKAGMSDKVILIAYSDAQARKLARLAPEMLLSLGIESQADVAKFEKQGVKTANMTAWLGRGGYDLDHVRYLDSKNIPVLAWPSRQDVKSTATPASLIVSDYAFSHSPIVGLTLSLRENYETCLAQN